MDKIENTKLKRDTLVTRIVNGKPEYLVVNGVHPTGTILTSNIVTGEPTRLMRNQVQPFWIQIGDFIQDNRFVFRVGNFICGSYNGEIQVLIEMVKIGATGDGEQVETPISLADHFTLCDRNGRLL